MMKFFVIFWLQEKHFAKEKHLYVHRFFWLGEGIWSCLKGIAVVGHVMYTLGNESKSN